MIKSFRVSFYVAHMFANMYSPKSTQAFNVYSYRLGELIQPKRWRNTPGRQCWQFHSNYIVKKTTAKTTIPVHKNVADHRGGIYVLADQQCNDNSLVIFRPSCELRFWNPAKLKNQASMEKTTDFLSKGWKCFYFRITDGFHIKHSAISNSLNNVMLISCSKKEIDV